MDFLLLLDFHKVLNSLSLEYLFSVKFMLSRVWIMNPFLRKKLLDLWTKGQLISKPNCQAMNSSKKRTNEFLFTTMRGVFIRFLEEIEVKKRHFEINWPLTNTES